MCQMQTAIVEVWVFSIADDYLETVIKAITGKFYKALYTQKGFTSTPIPISKQEAENLMKFAVKADTLPKF